MLPVYNYFTAILGILTAGLIIYLIRRDSLSSNYVVWWFGVAAGLIFVGFFPKIVNFFGKLLGVGYPPVILIAVSWCLVLIKLLFMDIDRSRQERRIRILAQKLALYEQQAQSGQIKPGKDEK
ncbi:DUF2304 domain-containing protein [Desulfonatronovibrio magnus]|uniref:DUF2304 domain-containing protein n=1 Tax=Desulfonatronovibrio magnus TaxID=698827 RepID=UPI0005EBE2E9|nr:DUF2304 domain-containing protein [Desulfonatronovibrio magnus]